MEQPVAIITGAGRGIGRATAVHLAALGYRLTIASRSEAELRETASAALTEGVGNAAASAPYPFPTNVAQFDEVERLVQGTLSRFGRLDAIVNCAGLAPVRPIAEMSVAEWHTTLDTNLSSAFYLCKAAWPTFERQRSGVVVNVSSAAARDPFPGFAAYAAAKAGLNLFGLSAAREGQKIGVTVHTVAPSAVETGMFREIMSAEQYPTEMTLSPDDVARVIAQCVRGELRHASGEVIYVHKTV